jgi:hypothetical protein
MNDGVQKGRAAAMSGFSFDLVRMPDRDSNQQIEATLTAVLTPIRSKYVSHINDLKHLTPLGGISHPLRQTSESQCFQAFTCSLR